MVPLIKGSDPSDVNSLRPVSLLPLPGKLLERLIYKHISTFLEANGLLDERQGDSRKGNPQLIQLQNLLMTYLRTLIIGIS